MCESLTRRPTLIFRGSSLQGKLRKDNLVQWSLFSPGTVVILAFVLAYVIFFVKPLISNTSGHILVHGPIPSSNVRGVDLRQMISYSRSWYQEGGTPYIGNNLYPPLATVLFVPLAHLDFTTAYACVSLATICSFLVLSLIIPLSFRGQHSNVALITLVAFIGFSSYGFLFELERGQFNVIATALCFCSIWLYHNHPNLRFLSYAMFTTSVQLKVYPLIFVVMFLRGWKDWRKDTLRIGVLILVNLACCFVLGRDVFDAFVKSLSQQAASPYVWIGNHSIRSFVSIAMGKGLDRFGMKDWLWLQDHTQAIEFVLLLIAASCFLIIIAIRYIRDKVSPDGYQLLVCTILSMVIPPVSHDYKLPILIGPVAILVANFKMGQFQVSKSSLFRLSLFWVFSFSFFLPCFHMPTNQLYWPIICQH